MSLEKDYFNEFYDFLSCISEAKCAERVLIIGSWAEYIYEEIGLVKREKFDFYTRDLDFLIIPESYQKAKNARNCMLIDIAREHNFIYEVDYKDGFSKFSKTNGFEVEFLIQQQGDGSKTNIPNSLGVRAIPMPHMQILSNNPINVSYKNQNIQVPTPEAYTVHKMVINHARGLKAEADREKIHNIIPHIDKNKADAIVKTLSTKEKKAYNNYINRYEPDYLERVSIHLMEQLKAEVSAYRNMFNCLQLGEKLGIPGEHYTLEINRLEKRISELEHGTAPIESHQKER